MNPRTCLSPSSYLHHGRLSINSTSNGTSIQPSSVIFIGFQASHFIYMCAALLGIIVSNACLAIRLSSIKETRSLLKLALAHHIVITIYFLGCSFCVSACLLFFGYSIYDEISCRAAIFLGLVFYLGQKACLYLFLVERTHSVQKKLLTRMKDKIYLSGMALVLIGFTSIGIAAFMYHVASYDEEQNICRIGLTRRIAIILLSWDIFVNIFLTFVFLKVCAPYMSRGYLSTFLKPVLKGTLEKLAFFHKYTKESEQDVGISQKALVKVIRKAVWGCLGLLPSTIINFTLLIVFAGRQKAWFFLTFATLDVTWSIIIIHWLTNSPQGMSSKPPSSTRISRVPSIQRSFNQQRQVQLRPPNADHVVVRCRPTLSL